MERVFVARQLAVKYCPATDYESIMVNSLSYRLTILSSYFTMRMETVEISETSVTQRRFVTCLYSAIRRTLQHIAVKKSCLMYFERNWPERRSWSRMQFNVVNFSTVSCDMPDILVSTSFINLLLHVTSFYVFTL